MEETEGLQDGGITAAGSGEGKEEADAGRAEEETVEGTAAGRAEEQAMKGAAALRADRKVRKVPRNTPRRRGGRKSAEEPDRMEKTDPADRLVRKALRGGNHVGVICFSLVLATIVFAVLMDMERRMLTDHKRAYAVTVKKELPEGELLTGENAGEYLELKEFAADAVPAGAFDTVEGTEGYSLAVGLEKGVILTASMLEARTERLRSMNEPVVAGFRAEEISQAVCGTLRAGDVIHICVVDPEKEEPVAVWEDVLVEQVFDGRGVRIPNGDTSSPAQAVNILLEREELERFYVELAKGSVRVAKER